MRLSHFGGGLDAAEAQFDASVLAGNLLGFDAWAVPHCLAPFAVAFLYDSLAAGLLGAYLYESLVVLLHVVEYNLDRDAERFYPYAGSISALIQDPLLGLMGALLGVLCASRYGPVLRRPPIPWGLLCLALLGASAVLSEVLWEPPPSAGLTAFVLVPLYVAPLWWREGTPPQELWETTAVLLWGATLLNGGCLVAYFFSLELPGGIPPVGNSSSVRDLRALGASVEEMGVGEAMLQTPLLWIVALTLPFWRLLVAAV